MKVEVKSVVLHNKDVAPYFKIESSVRVFDQKAVVIKVLGFSLDPVMRVWLSGAKTNFRQVGSGDIFNCFGVGQVIQSSNQSYPLGMLLFGNTGTSNYLELDEARQRECFPIDQQLIKKWGVNRFLYLINNGLAAFQGFEILGVKPGENVVVSTAAGATGLLLCHLLKKRKANIIAISSQSKHNYLTPFTNKILNYKDRSSMNAQLRKIKYSKYFDNVGESQLDLVLATIQNFGICALCGAIQNYTQHGKGGIANYMNVISKRIKMEGINFSSLVPRASEIFQEYKDADLLVREVKMQEFSGVFCELFRSGGSVVGKVIVNPHS